MICAGVFDAAVVVVVVGLVVVLLVVLVGRIVLVVVVAELACEEVLVGAVDVAACEEASNSVEIGPQAHNETTKNKQRITVHIFFILKTPFITTSGNMLDYIILTILGIVKKLSMII